MDEIRKTIYALPGSDRAEIVSQQIAELEPETRLSVKLVIWDASKGHLEVFACLERILKALNLPFERINEFYLDGDMYTLEVPASAFSLVDRQRASVYAISGLKEDYKSLSLDMAEQFQQAGMTGQDTRFDIPLGALYKIEVLD
ncbi:MAG: hypothetical protein JW870_16840 [Candidatus Delongbacteria bacterium]|nr:hypothetical protein [Candidatus Delongbacteria bacterium]